MCFKNPFQKPTKPNKDNSTGLMANDTEQKTKGLFGRLFCFNKNRHDIRIAEMKVLAIKLEFHGMLIENETRLLDGLSPAYHEDSFDRLRKCVVDIVEGLNC